MRTRHPFRNRVLPLLIGGALLFSACERDSERNSTDQRSASTTEAEAAAHSARIAAEQARALSGDLPSFIIGLADLDESELRNRLLGLRAALDTDARFNAAARIEPVLLRWREMNQEAVLDYLVEDPSWLSDETFPWQMTGRWLADTRPDVFVKLVRALRGDALQKVTQWVRHFFEATHPVYAALDVHTEPAAVAASEGLQRALQLKESDPLAALAELRKLKVDRQTVWQYRDILNTIASSEPEAAAQMALEIAWEDPEMGEYLATAIGPWFALDPEAAFNSASALPGFRLKNRMLEEGYKAWAQKDPLHAVQHAEQNVDANRIKRNVMTAALTEWMRADPAAAANHLQHLPAHVVQQYSKIFGPWVQKEPAAALEFFLEMSKGQPRFQTDTATTLERMIGTWIQQDKSSAVAWVQSLPSGKNRDRALATAVGSVGADNEGWALQMAGEIKSPHFRQAAMKTIVERWEAYPPEQSMALLEALPENVNKTELYSNLVRQWKKDLGADGLTALYPADRSSELQRAFILEAAGEMAKSDFDATYNWALDLPDDQRELAVNRSFWAVRRSLPPAEAAALLASFPAELHPRGSASYVANDWVRVDPAASQEWALTLPPERGQSEAIRSNMQYLLGTDAEAAQSFIGRMEPKSAPYETAVNSASQFYANVGEPVASLSWALKLTNGYEQRRRFDAVLTHLDPGQREVLYNDLVKTQSSNQKIRQLIDKYFQSEK